MALEETVHHAARDGIFEISVELFMYEILKLNDDATHALIGALQLDRRTLLTALENHRSRVAREPGKRPAFSEIVFDWIRGAQILAVDETAIRSSDLLLAYAAYPDRYSTNGLALFGGVDKEKLRESLNEASTQPKRRSLFSTRLSETRYAQPLEFKRALVRRFPDGPTRQSTVRQSLPEQLNELALVTKDTLIYDCDDHWFYVFIGIAEIGGSFELSLRHRKTQEASPPAWPLAPCARLANAVGYGMHLVPGTTVKIEQRRPPLPHLEDPRGREGPHQRRAAQGPRVRGRAARCEDPPAAARGGRRRQDGRVLAREGHQEPHGVLPGGHRSLPRASRRARRGRALHERGHHGHVNTAESAGRRQAYNRLRRPMSAEPRGYSKRLKRM